MTTVLKPNQRGVVQRHQIAYFWDLNVRSDKEFKIEGSKATDLIVSIVNHGGFDVVQFHVIVSPIEYDLGLDLKGHKDFRARALAERTAQWASLKLEQDKNGTADTLAMLTAFEYTYVNPKTNKLYDDILYLGASGNCRDVALLHACAQVAKEIQGTGKNLSDVFRNEIAVVVVHFPDAKSRMLAQLFENDGKNDGFTRLTYRDRLKAVKVGVQSGSISQNDLRDNITATEGQRAYYFLMLDRQWPGLKLYDRVFLDKENPAHLTYEKIKGSDLPNLSFRSNESKLKDVNAKRRKESQSELTLITDPSEVEAEIVAMMTGTSKKNSMMQRGTIEQVQMINPNPIVQATMAAVIGNNTAEIEKLTEIGPACQGLLNVNGKSDGHRFFALVEKYGTLRDKQRIEACDLFEKIINAAAEQSEKDAAAEKEAAAAAPAPVKEEKPTEPAKAVADKAGNKGTAGKKSAKK